MANDRVQPTSTDVNDLEKMLRRAGLPEISPELAPKLRAITVATVAQLRTISGDLSGNRGPACCVLNATVTPGDGGVGVFYWHDTLQTANGAAFDDNGVTYVQVMGPSGQFKTPGAWVRAQFAKIPDVQTFSGNGTWTKPAGATWVRVELVPWGASGGSGRRGAIGADNGGAGGASGVSAAEFPASILGAAENLTFGSQPIGGAGQTVDNTDGRNGTDAPDATFGAWLVARGGKKGPGGQLVGVQPGGVGGYGNMGTGGNGGNTNGGAATAGTGRAGGGGGGGGPVAGVGVVGGNGGPDRATNLAGGAAGAAGAAGGAGSDGAVGEVGGGGGGGGGGGQNAGTVGAGGIGGRYGAGGGGGGASNNGTTSGAGGNGAPCFGRVTTWFT